MNTTKTPEEIATAIKEWSEITFAAEEGARKQLAENALAGFALSSYNMRPVLEAQAAALPWRHVTRSINGKKTPVEALREVRKDATEALVGDSESQSTCAMTNDVARMEREAWRRFLRQTRRLAG
jgi:hypothetical protein